MPLPMMTTSAVSVICARVCRKDDEIAKIKARVFALAFRVVRPTLVCRWVSRDKLKLVGHALPYAGAGVPPVIGGRIRFSGFVSGAFSLVPGSSCWLFGS